MTAVPTMARQSVRPMALSCSTPERRWRRVGQAVVLGRLRRSRLALAAWRGQEAGQEGAQGAADGVDAEGVQRVVVAEPAFSLQHGEEGDQARQRCR